MDKHEIEHVLQALPRLHLAVVGDLFLDRYLDLDAGLTEPSVETGLAAFQVVGVRSSPGAAGTVLNNLAALGVGKVSILSAIGDDAEGFELRRELLRRRINLDYLLTAAGRFTPTYTKPMLHETGKPARELNRLDLKNRSPMLQELEKCILEALPRLLSEADGLVVSDQVREPECGVITTAVRDRLAELGAVDPAKLILADSRERIGLFREVWLKPNQLECRAAVPDASSLEDAVRALANRSRRPVFCTRGERGILLFDPRGPQAQCVEAPAYPVSGPIDVVGAGDSVNAGIACAIAAGASLVEAADFGNQVASVTIRQLGTTGTASPNQLRARD